MCLLLGMLHKGELRLNVCMDNTAEIQLPHNKEVCQMGGTKIFSCCCL